MREVRSKEQEVRSKEQEAGRKVSQRSKVEGRRLTISFLSLRAASEAISLVWAANWLGLCEKLDSFLFHHKEIAASLSLQGLTPDFVNAMTKVNNLQLATCNLQPFSNLQSSILTSSAGGYRG